MVWFIPLVSFFRYLSKTAKGSSEVPANWLQQMPNCLMISDLKALLSIVRVKTSNSPRRHSPLLSLPGFMLLLPLIIRRFILDLDIRVVSWFPSDETIYPSFTTCLGTDCGGGGVEWSVLNSFLMHNYKLTMKS